MSSNNTQSSTKKRRNRISFYFIICVVIALLLSLTNNDIRRELFKIYNRCSVFLEQNTYNRSAYVKHFGISIPKDYHVYGIDVSRYQYKINWTEVAEARADTLKISFAFIKATEGKTLSDRYYEYNIANARENGIICGAYHYYKPNVSSTEQAENFIKLVNLQAGDLPPVLDIEELGDCSKEEMKKGIKNWLQIIEKHYGIKPIIYTYNNFHRDYLAGDEFDDYPFWIAHYYKAKIRTSSNWIFWQCSDYAQVNGITGDVDFNVYNGTIENLKQVCKKE